MYTETRRVTLSGSSFTAYEFKLPCTTWLIKNFSSNPIYVSFDENATTANAIKISKEFYQVCGVPVPKIRGGDSELTSTDTIYIKGSGEVEINQIF